MAEIYDIGMVETLLRYEISRKNLDIRRCVNKEGLNFSNVFSDIYKKFAMGSANNLTTYWEIQKDSSTKSYKIYNYFDLETLYSFNAFLDQILYNADKLKMRMPSAIDDAIRMFITNKNKKASGFYDAYTPIKVRLNEKGEFSPIKKLTYFEIDQKYGFPKCQKELEKYIEYRTGEKVNAVAQTKNDTPENNPSKKQKEYDKDGNEIKRPRNYDPDQLTIEF